MLKKRSILLSDGVNEKRLRTNYHKFGDYDKFGLVPINSKLIV